MPACRECEMLIGGQCTAMEMARVELGRPLPPPPLGACIVPIVQRYLAQVRRGDSVLDIGCGSWDRIKSHCERIGARYEAIDIATEYFGGTSGRAAWAWRIWIPRADGSTASIPLLIERVLQKLRSRSHPAGCGESQ